MLVTSWSELQEIPAQWHGVDSNSTQLASELVGSAETAALSANKEIPSEFSEEEREMNVVKLQKKNRRNWAKSMVLNSILEDHDHGFLKCNEELQKSREEDGVCDCEI